MNKQQFTTRFQTLAVHQNIDISNEKLEKIAEFFFLLHEQNRIHNLTGYKETEDLFFFHFMDSLILYNHLNLKPNSLLTDVGTGAGIPGLILKFLYPNLILYLIESVRKKAAFLVEMKSYFNMRNCHILAERSEIISQNNTHREKSDIVTARALGPLSTTLELTCPLAKKEGHIFLPRGSREDDFEKSQAELTLGCSFEKEIPYTLPGRDRNHRILIYKKNQKTDDKYPRKPSQIKKRPL
ncbi:16S rRNA (guanine(527)-N(7))-methyltransferase RsmG [bacterium]|nr:16S rRNA (guanine(527)-N(7))-methyltransferase RsmG [bacterium]